MNLYRLIYLTYIGSPSDLYRCTSPPHGRAEQEARQEGKSNQYWSANEPVLVATTDQYWSRREAVVVTSPTTTGRKSHHDAEASKVNGKS